MIGTGLGVTDRHDAWWIAPLATALGFGGFIVYSTFRAIYNTDFQVEFSAESAHILSPFYSPLLVVPSWMPTWVSPAFFILWMPGGFRVTCYYYRKAYYRAYFLDPPACAVGEARGTGYKGETRLFLLQNLHRYMLYLAIIIIGFLAYDVILALIWPVVEAGEVVGKTLGASVGTVVLGVNVVFLSMYTFGCHSFRHLVGGKLDCFSCDKVGKARYGAWRGVTKLNEHHMLWAWVSLFMVGFTDLYVWMIASDQIEDIRIPWF